MPLVMAACLAGAVAGVIILIGRRFGGNNRMLTLALNHMSQGVVMFDTAGRLAVCNQRYLEIYSLSPDIVKPGASLIDVVRHRFETGNLDRDPVAYCAELMDLMKSGKEVSFVSELTDGRAIAVLNRAIPGSNYWLGTHHDITARRAAERKSALLNEQQSRRAVVDDAIAWFRGSVEGVLKTVTDSVAAMQSTATALAATSNEST
ncbi:MAG: PAS-domain containing protein, partial [Xanthobacteraceae bacterium]